MGEAKNRKRRADEYISEGMCDLISEATAEALAKELAPLLHRHLAAECLTRAAAGEDYIVPHRLPVGIETGVMLTLLAVVWGYLPSSASKRDLIDQYRQLVPLMVEGLQGPPGQLVDDAMKRMRAGMH